MKDFIKIFDELPFIVKILLAIFVDIIISVYRIIKGIDANNTTAIVVGIITCIIPPMCLIDLIYLIVKKKYWSIA